MRCGRDDGAYNEESRVDLTDFRRDRFRMVCNNGSVMPFYSQIRLAHCFLRAIVGLEHGLHAVARLVFDHDTPLGRHHERAVLWVVPCHDVCVCFL